MCRLQRDREDCVNLSITDRDNWIVTEKLKYISSLLLSKD